MSSSANVNPANIMLSPMRVTYNSVDLGGTEGGVGVSMKTKQADIKADQFGDVAIDSVVSAQEFSVKLTLAESKNKDNWKVAFPFNKEITSGPNKQMYFDMAVGTSLYALSKQLVLHPLANNDSDKSGDFLFYKAVAKSATEVKYGPDKQVGLEVEFMIFPDTATSPARYCVHGDPAIGAVAATLTQSSFTGTGNGTLSAISAGSQAVTETLTLTCIHAATNGGIFEVIGSVSGSLGNARVGTPFLTSKGNFTIGDGTTDFIVGDVFALASTAANYA
jgi:hypothetical protein